ncbi:hypothetical protein MBLNU13_g08854t2 [Cladosporium sp. NU13]
MFGRHRYRPIENTEQEDVGFEKATSPASLFSPEPESQLLNRSFWHHVNRIFFCFSLSLFLASIYNINYSNMSSGVQANSYFLKQTSMPSPILDDIDLRVKRKKMDTTFVQQQSSYYLRQKPGPQVDAAWWSLLDTRPIAITKERVLEIGKDPAEAVKIPESWGHGSDMYFGRIDVFHHIHCLDALRKEAYFEHYYGERYPGGLNDTSDFHREHLSHCIYLLLQNVLCSANTDVYTHVWVDNLEHPWPDFENALDEKAFSELVKPEGYPVRKANHRFKEVNGWFKDHEDDGDLVSGQPA